MNLTLIMVLMTVFIACNTSDKKEEKIEEKKDEFTLLNDQIVKEPGNAELYFKRSKEFLNRKNLRQAFTDIEKAVSLDSMKFEYYMLHADISFQGLQIAKAVKSFESAVALNPENIDAHLKFSELLLYLKAYPRSLKEANEALRIDKNIAKAYFIKGFAYKETGDTSKAISSFQTAVEINPDYYDAYIQLGNIEAAGRHPVALQYYNNALRLMPNSTEALYNRALLLQNMGDLDNAITNYEGILKIDPSYSDAYFNLGYIQMIYKSDYKSAIKYFTDAIRVNSQYTEAFYNRGLCYEAIGDKQSAIKDFNAALGILPTYKPAKEKLKKMN